MVQWAMQEEQLPLEVIERETKTFRDHTFGRTITDWVATWRNWMRKAASFSNHRSHHKGGIGATLDKQAQTKSFIAAVKGDANGAGFKDTFDVESRVIRRDEEPPLDPGP